MSVVFFFIAGAETDVTIARGVLKRGSRSVNGGLGEFGGRVAGDRLHLSLTLSYAPLGLRVGESLECDIKAVSKREVGEYIIDYRLSQKA